MLSHASAVRVDDDYQLTTVRLWSAEPGPRQDTGMSPDLGVTGHLGNQGLKTKAPTLQKVHGTCITFSVGTAGQRPGLRAHGSRSETGSGLGVAPSSRPLCTDSVRRTLF